MREVCLQLSVGSLQTPNQKAFSQGAALMVILVIPSTNLAILIKCLSLGRLAIDKRGDRSTLIEVIEETTNGLSKCYSAKKKKN